MVPWVGVGAFIVSTRPRNPIGWLFSAVGLLWLSGEVIYDWALGVTDPSDQFLPYASLFSDSYWIPGLGLLFVAVMLFPSGRLPSVAGGPRLCWLGWLGYSSSSRGVGSVGSGRQ